MNEYLFKDLKTGMKESFQKNITKEMEDAFREITGDYNPLHKDDSFAKTVGERKFSSHVVFGMLTAALCSTLAGMYLPGKYSLIHSIDELSFLNPVFPGDTLTVEGEITDTNEALKLIIIRVTMKNEEGKKVAKAKMKVLVLR